MAEDGNLDAELMIHSPLPIVIVVLLTILVLIAAFRDLRVRRIPNWITLPGLVIGIALNSFLFGWAGLWQSLGGAGTAFAVYILLYFCKAMGMGDVKLMIAIGGLVGPERWLVIFLITALIGGLAALILVTTRGRFRRTLENVRYILAEMSHLRAPYVTREELSIKGEKAMTLPHGAIIALGCLAYLGLLFTIRVD